jgi:hypothetical protein
MAQESQRKELTEVERAEILQYASPEFQAAVEAENEQERLRLSEDWKK